MRLPGTRSDERFFISRYIPRPWLLLNLGVLKLTIWGPWPFVSLAFGWFDGRMPKVRALQLYLGIKCDGTQSFLRKEIVMVLTLKELAACRIHGVNINAEWNNQGGC